MRSFHLKVTAISLDKVQEVLPRDLKELGGSVDINKVRFRAALAAKFQMCRCPLSDKPNLFELDNDLPLLSHIKSVRPDIEFAVLCPNNL